MVHTDIDSIHTQPLENEAMILHLGGATNTFQNILHQSVETNGIKTLHILVL